VVSSLCAVVSSLCCNVVVVQAEQAEVEYEHQLEQEKQRIQQEAQENLTVKDRKLRLLKNIVNQSDIESLAGELARSTPSLPPVCNYIHCFPPPDM